MSNEAFGWAWITLGIFSGLLLGLRFHDEKFLGGYSSWPRRLLRLGHISFLGLGILNILFALGSAQVVLDPEWFRRASVALIVGGVSMPACCTLCAWRRTLWPVFMVPVASIGFASVVTAWGMLR